MTKKSSTETEKKIKQAAKEIFLEKGFEGARTRDITKKSKC
jgi:AcrR family transcriptional regulator